MRLASIAEYRSFESEFSGGRLYLMLGRHHELGLQSRVSLACNMLHTAPSNIYPFCMNILDLASIATRTIISIRPIREAREWSR